MKTLLLSIILVLGCAASVTSAQTDPSISAPTITNESAERVNDPKLKVLTELLSNPDLDCEKESKAVIGRISKLYFNNGGKTLSAIQIHDKMVLYSMNLTADPFGAVGKYSFETIKGVFTKNRKI